MMVCGNWLSAEASFSSVSTITPTIEEYKLSYSNTEMGGYMSKKDYLSNIEKFLSVLWQVQNPLGSAKAKPLGFVQIIILYELCVAYEKGEEQVPFTTFTGEKYGVLDWTISKNAKALTDISYSVVETTGERSEGRGWVTITRDGKHKSMQLTRAGRKLVESLLK